MEPFQEKSSTSSKNVSTEVLAIDKGGGIYVEEGSHPKNICEKRSILEQPVFSMKIGWGNRPVISLKNLNAFIPYLHFKMEDLHLLKDMLKEKDYMCKKDLKDAYFCVPLHQKHRKYIRFCWEGQLYEFLCLCFSLGPAPRIFTKLLKIPIAILRRIKIRVIVYLDDMLLMSQTIESLEMARNTLIFLLQELGFTINLKKSVLSATQKLEFLGLEINSVNMTLTLPMGKVKSLT